MFEVSLVRSASFRWFVIRCLVGERSKAEDETGPGSEVCVSRFFPVFSTYYLPIQHFGLVYIWFVVPRMVSDTWKS